VTVKLTLDAAGRTLLSAHHGRLNASLRILKSLPAPAQMRTEKVYLVPRKPTKAKKHQKKK
jgi:hypothetical protein